MGLAITKAYTGISNVLTTPVSVTNIATKQKIKTEGIWDTGATNSVITQRLAKQLGLNIISYARSNGVGAGKEWRLRRWGPWRGNRLGADYR